MLPWPRDPYLTDAAADDWIHRPCLEGTSNIVIVSFLFLDGSSNDPSEMVRMLMVTMLVDWRRLCIINSIDNLCEKRLDSLFLAKSLTIPPDDSSF